MQVKEAILHKIVKESKSKDVTTDPRKNLLPIEETLGKLVSEVLSIYNRVSNGYGTFDANETVYPFPKKFKEYIEENASFIELSTITLELIAAEMRNQVFATGGYVLFVRYNSNGRDWLLVVMLKMRESTGVNEDTKELLRLLSLDVEQLHEAARIDIEKWQGDEQPYLSFVKKRSGKDDVTQYFREALGCTDYTDSKQNTQTLLDALQDYTNDKEDPANGTDAWDRDKVREARRKTFEYCQEKTRNKEEVNLEALSAIINDRDPSEFRNFVKDNGYQVNDSFTPHANTYRRLNRIKGKASGNVTVAFDVDDLVERRVLLQDGNLIIQGASPALISQIEKAQADDDTE